MEVVINCYVSKLSVSERDTELLMGNRRNRRLYCITLLRMELEQRLQGIKMVIQSLSSYQRDSLQTTKS